MWKMQIVTDNLHFLCLLKSYDAKYGKMKTTASIPSNEGENRMKKCKILALMLSISMAMGQMGPMTVMAAEQNASSEAMNTVAYEEGWLDVESANDWDAEWYWGSETSGINNDSEMWWGDSEVVEYSEESEVESDDAAVYQLEEQQEAVIENDEIIETDEAEEIVETVGEDAESASDEAAVQSEEEAVDESETQERPASGTAVRYNDQITYVVNEDGETCMVGCTDTSISGTVEIPSELDGFTVTAIAPGGFANCQNLTNIILPETLTTIGVSAFMYSSVMEMNIPASVTNIDFDSVLMQQNGPTFGGPILQNFNVDEDNPVYCSVDGVLFNKEKTSLLAYPAARVDNYNVPDGTIEIGPMAFAFSGAVYGPEYGKFEILSLPKTLEEIGAGAFSLSALRTLNIPASVKKISGDMQAQHMPSFWNCPLLKTINVDEANIAYASQDGVLFSKDMTYLLHYPEGAQNVEYKMPDSVTSVITGAFCEGSDGAEYALEKVICSSNLENIGVAAFQANFSIKEIDLPVTLHTVADYAFDSSNAITDVYYGGTEEDRDEIVIGTGNTYLTNATWHYTEPEKKTFVEGSLTYQVNEDGESCSVVACDQDITGEVVVPAEVNGLKVTSIGNGDDGRAFYNCKQLEKVIVSEGITSIEFRAFDSCENLTTVQLPSSLEKIGENAFYDCKSLVNINLPDNLKEIISRAFYGCESLEEINLPAGLEKLGNEVFHHCNKLKSIVIPDGITEIGYWTFWDCTSLQTVILPDNLQKIGDHAFDNCTSLVSIDLPKSLEVIEGSTFWSCTSLEDITIPESVTRIDSGAFKNCENLKTVMMSKNIKEICNYAFANCPNLQDVYYDGTKANRDAIVVEEANEPLMNAVWHYKEAASWKLEDGVLTISGEGAMENYAKAVKQPWYEKRAQITSVVVEDGITEIGDFAFYGLTYLKEVSIADSVTKIGDYAFKNCSALSEVNLPEKLESVGESAFYGCTALKDIIFHENVQSIGSYAFSRCTELKKIVFEGDAPEIQTGAFSGVRASVSYPEEKASWTEDKKQNYGGQLSWNQPLPWNVDNHVLTITNDSCMKNYESAAKTPWYAERNEVTSIIVADGVTKIGDYAFYGYSNLASVQLPDSLESIGNYAFKNCGKLSEITLPEKVSAIGESAFYGCGLAEITIPLNVTEIADYSFARNTGLKNITFEGSAPAIAAHAFSGVKAKAMYPEDDSSWNEDTKQNYGGTLQWGDTEEKQQCGKNAYWKVENGTLTISGSGAIGNYDSAAECPWADQRASITKIVVEDGITSIGNFAFYGMTNLTETSLADSITSIGAYAFKNDSNLETVALPSELTQIQDSAFYGCSKISSIVIPAKVTKIGDYVFSRCSSLKDISFEGDAPEIAQYAFNKVTANVTYAGDNGTWTDENKLNYGGKLTWTVK